MSQYSTIVDLLNKLCNDYRHLTWKVNSRYVNSLGKTIQEIFIYEFSREFLRRKISFQLDSGRVLDHNIKEINSDSDSITDLLLDLINHERKSLVNRLKRLR